MGNQESLRVEVTTQSDCDWLWPRIETIVDEVAVLGGESVGAGQHADAVHVHRRRPDGAGDAVRAPAHRAGARAGHPLGQIS